MVFVRLAQLVERYIDIVEVTSSSLVPDTITSLALITSTGHRYANRSIKIHCPS